MPLPICETRTALLDAAEELFSAHGYDAVGIREIAGKAEANLASIKYHFGSKRDLYLHTVSRAMGRSGGTSAWNLLHGSPLPNDAPAAAALLVRFIRAFLEQSLPPEGIDACGTLIIREGMQPSEALDSVVEQYIQPNQNVLVQVLLVLQPSRDAASLSSEAQSILGQLVHYRVFRAIIERLRGIDLSEPAMIAKLSDHIARFSLRGLGFDEPFIENAMTLASSSEWETKEPASE